MNILIITDYYPPDKLGGVGEIAKNLKITYETMGHNVWVLTTGVTVEKNVVRGAGSLTKGVLLNNIRAIKLIRLHNIDVVNMHQSSTTLFLVAKYLPFYRKRFPKIVNSLQVSYFSEYKHIKKVRMYGKTFQPTLKEYIEKYIFAPVHIIMDFIGYIASDVITVVSSENKKEFEKTYGKISSKTINVIPNGVNPDVFSLKNAQLDKKTEERIAGKTVFLYVGVFRVRKRVFNLLYALQRAKQKNTILMLVGGGRNYEKNIKSLAKELKIEDRVIFVGRVPNSEVVRYLNSADVFCLLSSYEGMPVAILEAMACGKAILTSRASGMIDLIEDGKSGFLTDVDDVKQISEKISYLANNKKETKSMGSYARNQVLRKYSWDKIGIKYVRLFEK